jgi:hypothetical protein
MGILRAETVERSGIAANQTMPLFDSLKVFMSDKFRKPGVALKDQLTPDEQAEFARLSQQLQAGMLVQLVVSHYDRDLRVFEQFVRLADQDYRWGPRLPKETDQDYIPYAILSVMRQKLPTPALTHPSQDRCSMEYALHQFISPALEALGAYKQINQGAVAMQSLLKKYNLQQPDFTKMSKADVDLFVRWRDYVQAALKIGNFIHDMERLKLMFRAAELNNRAKTQDLTFAAGDINKIGATVQHMMEHNQLEEPVKIALGLWFAVNEKIPSDVTNSLDMLPATTRKQPR